MPYAHLERCSACSVFCSRDHPATDTGFRHQGPSRNRSQAVIRLIFGSASARRPCPQVLQWHPHVPNNPTISLKPASNRTSTGPRHGNPIHKYLRAIPAWQSRHLSSLRHGHPVYRYSSAIPTCRTIQQSLSNRPLTVPRPVLATATLPTDTSVPSPRAETYQNRSLKDVPSGS